ncbi:hypothetical protein JCM3775_001426 [Rhodotorula graminis]
MSSWTHRAVLVDQALAQLPVTRDDENSPPDLRLHLALVRASLVPHGSRDQPPPLKKLKTAALAVHDFVPLSTLASSGSFARVELVRPAPSLTGTLNEPTSAVLVLKTVDKRWAFRMRAHQHIRHELAVLRLSRSTATAGRTPSLVASFLSPTSFHLVLSHAPGGDLWTILERQNEGLAVGQEQGLPEEWVRGWTAELVDAVAWLHDEGWAHRDIKPQNVLLDAAGHVQLTDFGSCAPLSPGTTSIARKHCRVLLGTPDYIAPEVLKHAERVYQEEEEDEEEQDRSAFGLHDEVKLERDQEARAYGAEVDWWACGVVLYELLYGRTPFFAEEISETYERIVDWQKHLEYPPRVNVSAPARATISSLLVAAGDRPSASTIKALPWFSEVRWDLLRTSTAAYIPPPFVPPAPSSSDSFARSHSTSGAQSFDFSSFFSSPGLSILRPSPRTTSAAQSEESEYWLAREYGGLTTLPPPDAFAPPPSSRLSTLLAPPAGDVAAVAPPSRTAHAPPPPSAAFSTPARPLSRLAHLSQRPESAITPRSGAGSSSARSRRVVSGMDAWREMQEHAWTVGRSAKKMARAGAGVGVPKGVPSAALAESARRAGPAPAVAGGEHEVGTPGRKINGLQRRQEGVVDELDRLEEKYRGLFELAARERV